MKKNLHNRENPQTTIEQTWQSVNTEYIDVRSPKEFESGHIPGAVSIPLLENKERESIGILYKNFGQQKAIERGYEYLDGKLDDFNKQFKELPHDKLLVVYCARGGMRSQVITSLCNHLSFDARQLTGGYKAFRNWNLAELNKIEFQCPVVLHGKTGVGKTLVLNRIDNSLDLEGLADHRGSLFGGIGKSPVTQKTFEANLLTRLWRQVTSDLVMKMDSGKYAECFEYILLNYYDRKYNHSMKQLRFEKTISTDDLNQADLELNNYAEELLSRF